MNSSHYHISSGNKNPRPAIALLAGLALVLAALSGPGPAWSALHQPRTTQAGTLLLNEIQYDPSPSGPDADWEWFELYNPTNAAVSLAGWSVSDNYATTPLPETTVPARGFLVVAATPRFLELFPGFTGLIAYMPGGVIGNTLSNSADRLILRDAQGQDVDKLSWGTDTSVFDPPCPDVEPGHSLERVPYGHDTDRASDFVDQENPTPGRGVEPFTPTPTGTATLTQTPTATWTPTPTATATGTASPTPSPSPSVTATISGPTPSPSASPTATATTPPTETATETLAATQTATATATVSPTATATPEETPTPVAWIYLPLLAKGVGE